MGVKFFGQFLLERNVINAIQLLEAVRYQEAMNLRFGDYVRIKDFLRDVDIRRLNDEQRRTDLMIGELAARLGLLTDEQVREVLAMQRNDHMFIGEALVKIGHIDHGTLVRELELFREDQKDFLTGDIQVPEELANGEDCRDFVDITLKLLLRIAGIAAKAGDGGILVDEPSESFVVVSVRLAGNASYDYVLSVSRGAAEGIVTGVMGEDASSEPDDILVDGVKEFCNIACGNITARLAKKGWAIEISPPMELKHSAVGYGIIKGSRAAAFPLISTAGEILLVFVEH